MYGSTKGTGGEKAKERDGTDCSAPVLAFYPPATHTHGHAGTQKHTCLLELTPKTVHSVMHQTCLLCDI